MNANPAGPAEAETHLTDEEYRVLWATSTDAVLIMDEHGTIRYANPAVLECLNLFLDVGCPPADPRGRRTGADPGLSR